MKNENKDNNMIKARGAKKILTKHTFCKFHKDIEKLAGFQCKKQGVPYEKRADIVRNVIEQAYVRLYEHNDVVHSLSSWVIKITGCAIQKSLKEEEWAKSPGGLTTYNDATFSYDMLPNEDDLGLDPDFTTKILVGVKALVDPLAWKYLCLNRGVSLNPGNGARYLVNKFNSRSFESIAEEFKCKPKAVRNKIHYEVNLKVRKNKELKKLFEETKEDANVPDLGFNKSPQGKASERTECLETGYSSYDAQYTACGYDITGEMVNLDFIPSGINPTRNYQHNLSNEFLSTKQASDIQDYLYKQAQAFTNGKEGKMRLQDAFNDLNPAEIEAYVLKEYREGLKQLKIA